MIALRKQVERVVRGVHASNRTKDRMRAELLEHFELLYQEELDRSADDALALAEATRRFGDCQALTRELQASVPLVEQCACLPLPGSRWGRRRSGEAIGAWILRSTAAATLASTVGITLVVVALAAFEHRWSKLLPILPILLAIPVLLWFTMAANLWSSELLRRQIERDVPPGRRIARLARIAGLAILSMGAFSLAPFVLLLMARSMSPYPLFADWQAAVFCVAWALVALPITALQTRDAIANVRRHEQWESLELADELSP